MRKVLNFMQKYGKSFESKIVDKKQLVELIHSLKYQITVYSKPRTIEDDIAGKKKEGQMIPNQVDIYLNLPQNLLIELTVLKFEVKSDNL